MFEVTVIGDRDECIEILAEELVLKGQNFGWYICGNHPFWRHKEMPIAKAISYSQAYLYKHPIVMHHFSWDVSTMEASPSWNFMLILKSCPSE
ncbi:hypothetical protein VNO78_26915 [Psophocarpus tetragonolobus]|uniref:Uncharacterized protein n=1 Tax=Psophocarpus tetragonolobus TaxID=3891 RepID=A0AAN9S053_PSOTE